MSDQDVPEPWRGRRIRIRVSIRALMIFVLIAGCVLALVVHRLRVRAAEAAYQQAKLTREVAEIALAEFVEGIATQNVESVEGEIALAEDDLKRAEERHERSRSTTEKAKVLDSEAATKEQQVRRAKSQLHEAQMKKMTVEATKVRTTEELKSEIEKAKVAERDKKAIYTEVKARWMSRLIW
jgi:HlyD family secretion protein